MAISQCDSEPIRIPGAIQPHGWLLAFDSGSLITRHASANVADLLGRSLEDVLDHSPDDWLAPADAAGLRRALAPADDLDPDAPMAIELQGASYEGSLHRVGGLVILELERFVPPSARSGQVLARALRRLQGASGLAALHEVTVREVRELTGCDRVVIYAFGAEGHGHVLAEAKADDVASYLGLNFPASDIPSQARELYRQNWLRMIPDVDYVPVPIVASTPRSGTPGVSNEPLDLTFSLLRSVSPVHREYMRNMGTESSISISLLKDGQLWGLISCVNRAPKHHSRDVRDACLSIGRLLSLQIAALEGLQESKAILATKPLIMPLVEQMQNSPEEVFESLAATPERLLALTDASGAAVVIGDRITLIGVCPTEAQVAAMAEWVASQTGTTGCFATSELSRVYSPAAEFADAASGLLAVLMPKPVRSMLIWFRPEVTRTVLWAGDPRKTPSVDANHVAPRLSPRHSFDAWKVLLELHSLPWEAHRIHAATELRRFAIELDLVRQVGNAQEAVASRDELVAVVSHDLRSPMTVVALQATVLLRTLIPDPSPSSRRMLAAAQSIQRATARMSDMLRDLLDLSTIEQGRFGVEVSPHSVNVLFEDWNALLTPLAELKRIALTFDCDQDLTVDIDAERLYQVISNLIGNALKFTADGGTVKVVAGVDPDDGDRLVRLSVEDTGIGMSADQVQHIFDRYWRVRDANPTGTGLGLYIARGVVEALGGTIWVQSEPGVGSTFHFTLRRTTSA